MNSYRIIDANVNRACEGLRVIEDIYRFIYSNKCIAEEARNIKHRIRKLELSNTMYRDSNNDIGKIISNSNNIDKKTTLTKVVDANFSRIQEALRSLEENLKLVNKYEKGKIIESIRYEVYTIQKKSSTKTFDLGIIYGITCEEISNGLNNVQIAEELLNAGVETIQYRDKIKNKKEKLQDCIRIKELCDKHNGRLIINDDIDIAIIVDAHGVHLGQDDICVKEAKKLFPSKIVGVSTHNIIQALEAQSNGADYIGVGPIFNTKTKKNPEECKGLDFLKEIKSQISIPYVAIGGINRKNIGQCIENGCETFAIINDIVSTDNIKHAVKEITKIIKEKKENEI